MHFSPDFIKAAKYVLDNFLSKPYSEGFESQGQSYGPKNEIIDRPVHGLVHTLRTTATAPVFLELLKKLNNKAYGHIDEKELEKIMIAQLFFVAGRQSEKSDWESYKRYHAIGAQAFEEYANKELAHLFSPKDIEKYKAIIADVDPKFKQTAEADLIRKAHALELIRARTPEHLFHKLGKDEYGYSGIGRGLLDTYKDEKIVVDLLDYELNLFEATGDMRPEFDIAPKGQYQIWTTDKIPGTNEPKTKPKPGGKAGEREVDDRLELKTYPEDTPVYKRAAKEENKARFIACQYSVEECLKQIVSVKPPFGVQLTMPGYSPKADASQGKPSDKLSKQESLEMRALKEQENLLIKEIGELKAIPEGGLDVLIAQKNNDLKEIQEKISKHKALQDKPAAVINWGAQNYHVMGKGVQGSDGVARDLVKIPGDGNCQFNAVLNAAKQAGFLPHNIRNHFELRQEVIRAMEEDYQKKLKDFQEGDGLDGTEKHRNFIHARGWFGVDGIYAQNIRAYNAEFGTNIQTMKEYLAKMRELDTWGGALELQFLSKVLQIKIFNHSTEHPLPVTIGEEFAARPIHLQHTGKHYNIYVAPNSWVALQENDPILVFDKHALNIRRESYAKLLKGLEQKAEVAPVVSGHLSYPNFVRLSEEVNKLELKEQELLDKLSVKDINQDARKALGIELNDITNEFKRQHEKLEIIRKTSMADPKFGEFIKQRYNEISRKYEDLIEKLKVSADDKAAKKILEQALQECDIEIRFIFRESKPSDQLYAEMAKHQSRKIEAQRLLKNEENLKPAHLKLLDNISAIHLRKFLKDKYNPGLSLEDNIKIFFKDPYVRGMLYQGGPVGGIAALEGKEPKTWIVNLETGYVNQELIDHYVHQLKEMVEKESEYPGRYPLYNAMGANLCVGNDVIRELSSVLNAKDYGALFRLFSDDFQYENAESFRADVYDRQGKKDDGPDFHKRGLACGLTPFQALQEESALDFWSHNRNVQGFDRWEHEILPKLKSILTDPKTLNELKEEYKEMVRLSDRLGARMNQFLLTKEDLDKYAWISGRYGYKVTSVKQKGQGAEPTDRMSEVLDFYKRSPDAFVLENKKERDRHFPIGQRGRPPAQDRKQVYIDDHLGLEDDERHLAQMQARLYLHPDLFEPGRMQVQTYYASPKNPKIIQEYNQKVRQFSQRLGGLILKAKAEGHLQDPKVPQDLTQTFIAYRSFKNASPTKHEEALKKLKELIDMGELVIPKESHGSPIFKEILQLVTTTKDKTQLGMIINDVLNKGAKNPKEKKEKLSECFYTAISNGDVATFEALINFYGSPLYNFKEQPIDFNVLSDGKSVATSAMVLAAKGNHADMIKRLIEIRKTHSWSAQAIKLLTWSSSPATSVSRTAADETQNQPLHYLAHHGNIEAFKIFAESMVKSWNLKSLLWYQGTTTNMNQNSPLHILAFNEPGVGDQRTAILNYLLKENPTVFNTLFGDGHIITPNNKGLSPLMMAALTQNVAAIHLFADKIKLSHNQRALYLWLAVDPGNRLPVILKDMASYGNVPGFVQNEWKIPEELRKDEKIMVLQDSEKPLTLSELESVLIVTLKQEPINMEAIKASYDEFAAAAGESAGAILVDKLKSQFSGENDPKSLEKLAKLVQEKRIPQNVVKTTEDTALITAAKSGKIDAVIQLCNEKDALKIQRTTKDKIGNTALHYLVKQDGSDKAIIALLSPTTWTTDPTRVKDNDGNNPLHLLAQLGKDTTLKAIDDIFKTPGKFWGEYAGVYSKFGYQSTPSVITGTVVGAIIEADQLHPAVEAKNKAGLTPIMIAVLNHPNNKELINYLCKAMALNPSDQHLYIDLCDAIITKNQDKIQSELKKIEKVKGWNASAPDAQILEIMKPKEIAKPVHLQEELKL